MSLGKAMLRISAEPGAFMQSLDKELASLQAFPKAMADELTAWQAEDMHRKRPKTEFEGNEASTKIFSRSSLFWKRYWEKKRGQKLTSAKKYFKQKAHTKPRSTRPVLRPALFEKLCERMMALMHKQLEWQ